MAFLFFISRIKTIKNRTLGLGFGFFIFQFQRLFKP